MSKRRIDDTRSRLLQTLQDNPALPALLRKLEPTALAGLLDRVGLNDAGELMALAPTRSLLQALDEALWKSPAAGAADTFDATVLIEWLEAWNEIGDSFVAERLAAMSDDYRALCLSHLVTVRRHHTLAFLAIPDDEVDVERDTLQPSESCALYGPYVITPTADEWDIVRASLDALWTEQPECLLRTLGMLDGAESMLAAQEARQQLSIDIAHERERHRENLGYVTGPGACAFLVFAATASIEELAALSAYDEETRRHLAAFGASHDAASPIHAPQDADSVESDDSIAGDDGVGLKPDLQGSPCRSGFSPTHHEADEVELQRLRAVLEHEQLLVSQDTLLLTDQQARKHSALRQLLADLAVTDQPAFERCARELAYLANVVMVGIRIEGAPPSQIAARDCAYATCNRGLEFVREQGLAVQIEGEPGLIRLFALGWRAQRGVSPSRQPARAR
jgi:hypothetical protein